MSLWKEYVHQVVGARGIENIGYGKEPLIHQVFHDWEALEELLKMGADINVVNEEGKTILAKAVWDSIEVPTLRLMLDYGAGPLHNSFDNYTETWSLSPNDPSWSFPGFDEVVLEFARKGAHKHRKWASLTPHLRRILRKSEGLLTMCIPFTFGPKRTWLNKDLIRRLAYYM